MCVVTHTCGATRAYACHDAFICVTWLIRMWDMTCLYVWNVSFICVTSLIQMCDMTCSYVWHVSFICVTFLIHMCDMSYWCVCHDVCIWVSWRCSYVMRHQSHGSKKSRFKSLQLPEFRMDLLNDWDQQKTSEILMDVNVLFQSLSVGRFSHVCDKTHSYVWHDSFICATWLIHMCDLTHSYVWHDSFICVTWLIHMCDMTHSYVRHDSFICVTWLIHICDVTYSYMCDMTH